MPTRTTKRCGWRSSAARAGRASASGAISTASHRDVTALVMEFGPFGDAEDGMTAAKVRIPSGHKGTAAARAMVTRAVSGVTDAVAVTVKARHERRGFHLLL